MIAAGGAVATAGIWEQFGRPWALIVSGVCLVAFLLWASLPPSTGPDRDRR
jgi:hypothetical protein